MRRRTVLTDHLRAYIRSEAKDKKNSMLAPIADGEAHLVSVFAALSGCVDWHEKTEKCSG